MALILLGFLVYFCAGHLRTGPMTNMNLQKILATNIDSKVSEFLQWNYKGLSVEICCGMELNETNGGIAVKSEKVEAVSK